jgi:hypothetical protein
VNKEGNHYDKFNPAKTRAEYQLGGGRADVEGPAGDALYLHVLFPTDTDTDRMPESTFRRDGEKLTVRVGELSYVFTLSQ